MTGEGVLHSYDEQHGFEHLSLVVVDTEHPREDPPHRRALVLLRFISCFQGRDSLLKSLDA